MIRHCSGTEIRPVEGDGMRKRTGTAAMAAMALVVAACGGSPDEDAAAPPTGATAPGSGAQRGEDVVSAVLQSPGVPVAKLAFHIDTRPVVGKPFGVKLLASASQALPELHLTIESSSLIAAPDTATLALDGSGTAVAHDITVTARQEGLAELTVRLKAGIAESVYVIPVLVTSAADAVAAPAPAPAAG
jgi:hypothetical protein